MKEATGEANMTVITIILIGVIVAIATPVVKDMMEKTSLKASCMNEGFCGYSGNSCTPCEQEKKK